MQINIRKCAPVNFAQMPVFGLFPLVLRLGTAKNTKQTHAGLLVTTPNGLIMLMQIYMTALPQVNKACKV